jgi:hypothetical protein
VLRTLPETTTGPGSSRSLAIPHRGEAVAGDSVREPACHWRRTVWGLVGRPGRGVHWRAGLALPVTPPSMRRRLLLVPLMALHNAPSGHPAAAITFSAPVLVSNWSDSADSQPAGPSGVSPATFYGLSETTFVGNENNVNSLWSYSTDAGATWAHVVHPGGFVAGCCPVAAVPLRPAAAPSPFFAGGFHDMGVGRLSSDTPFKTQRRHPLSFEQTAAGALNMTQDKSDDVRPEITFSGIPYPGVNTSAEWGPPVAFGVLHVAPGELVALTQVIWNGDPVIKGADGLQQPTSLLAFQSSDGYHWKFASVISNASWVRAHLQSLDLLAHWQVQAPIWLGVPLQSLGLRNSHVFCVNLRE